MMHYTSDASRLSRCICRLEVFGLKTIIVHFPWPEVFKKITSYYYEVINMLHPKIQMIWKKALNMFGESYLLTFVGESIERSAMYIYT